MTSVVEVVAQLLATDDRETVLGDLTEAGESGWRALWDICGLVVLQQIALWRDWRPWAAGFGLALPCSLTLMGISVSLSSACVQYVNQAAGLLPLVPQVSLLIAGAWVSGFVAGCLSRRTFWHSVLMGCGPCLFCLARFRIESLSPLCLLLFLPAAFVGLRHSRSAPSLPRSLALVLGLVVTISIIFLRSSFCLFDGALLWPAWYLVATSGHTTRNLERSIP